jgi:hypothetical protein
VQELAVVLRQPDDRRVRAGLELVERRELAVLGLLEVGVDRPSVRAAVGVAQPLADPLDHVVAEALADLVRMHVRLGRRVAHEVGQEPLDEPVLAHDPLRPLAPGGSEDRLLVLAALDEALGLQALQHLAGRGPGDAEHLGHPRRQRRRALGLRPVLADGEGEEVDRLEVFVDGMTLGHGPGNSTWGNL